MKVIDVGKTKMYIDERKLIEQLKKTIYKNLNSKIELLESRIRSLEKKAVFKDELR